MGLPETGLAIAARRAAYQERVAHMVARRAIIKAAEVRCGAPYHAVAPLA